MIVQPDFVEHFKTKALVKLTKDEASPLAVLRLWGHCQTSRRWQFPNMTPEQLAALCAWGNRKPACHTALIKAGFVKPLAGGGFEAHQWDQQNGTLIQKWAAGRSGGRPKKGADGEAPEGSKSNRSKTDRLSVENRSKTDQIRLDQIGSDVPKSNSGGGDGYREGGPSSAQDDPLRVPVEESDAGLLVVPEFEPLPEGMFQRELEPMLKAARWEKARVESCDAACVWREEQRNGYDDDVEWYQNELRRDDLPADRRQKLEKEFEALKASRMVRVRGPLKAEAVAVIRAWSARIEEIDKALKGVKR